MKTEKILSIVSITLMLFSLLCFQWEIIANDELRLLTSGIFTLLAFKVLGSKKILGLLIFVAMILCDYFLLEWGTMLSKFSYYFLHSLLILVLIVLTGRDIKWQTISLFEIVSVFFFLLVFSFIFLELREYFSIDGALLKILFTVNGFLLVLLLVISFFLSINSANVLSYYFFLGITGLVISDLMLFSIYILEVPTFFYVDNVFYVIGLFFLLKASLENRLTKKAILVTEEKEQIQDPTSVGVYR